MNIYESLPSYSGRTNEVEADPHQGMSELPATFADAFANTYNLTYSRYTEQGRAANYSDIAKEEFIKLQKAGIDVPLATTGMPVAPSIYDTNNMPLTEVNWEKTFSDNADTINKLKQEKPELSVKSWEDIHAQVLKQQQALMDEDARLSNVSTGTSKAGWLAGLIAGQARDPINAVSMLAGAAPYKATATLLQNALRIGSLEAGLNVALEAGQKSSEVAFREATGEQVTAGDIAFELGAAGVLGAGLGVAGAGAAHGLSVLLRNKPSIVSTVAAEAPVEATEEARITTPPNTVFIVPGEINSSAYSILPYIDPIEAKQAAKQAYALQYFGREKPVAQPSSLPDVLGFDAGQASVNVKLPETPTLESEISRLTKESLDRVLKNIDRSDRTVATPFSSTQLDFVDLMQEAVDIAEVTPPSLSQSKHFEAYAAARQAIHDGEDVNVEAITGTKETISPIVSSNTIDTILPEEAIDTIDTPEYVQYKQQVVDSIKQQLDTEDLTIPGFTEAGDRIDVSAKAVFKELDNESSALQETINCLLKGTNNG